MWTDLVCLSDLSTNAFLCKCFKTVPMFLSLGPCAPPLYLSPRLPSPPPPPPVLASGHLRLGTVTGGVQTELRVQPGWDKRHLFPTSSRSFNRDHVRFSGNDTQIWILCALFLHLIKFCICDNEIKSRH